MERTYANKFGYSLGYARNSFEIEDGNNSEEWVDTLQLGVHNTYKKDGLKYRGDLTGRINMHNVDRNIDWTGFTENLDDKYMSYGVSFDNVLLKEFQLSKAFTFSPLVSMNFGYQYFDSLSEEESISALNIDSNDAYSIKPGVGVRIEGNNDLGSKGWMLKSGLELRYEYELGDSQPRETASLQLFDGNKYQLAQPKEDKGELKLRAMIGAEVTDRYGIFLTGEYGKEFNESESNGENYRAGVILKAVF